MTAAQQESTRFTVNIQKGGALLDDCRRVVEAWDESTDVAENLERVRAQNLLGKTSRARTDDVLLRVIRPRLVDAGPQVIPALKGFLDDFRAFRDACYYEATRDDPLLAAFVEAELYRLWSAGRVGVTTADVDSWLGRQHEAGLAPSWSEQVRLKVSRGVLAALRDFGILSGGQRKEIAGAALTTRGFAYVAWRLHEQGASSRSLVSTPVWRRWLLDPPAVQDRFDHASRLGTLTFASVGSAVRIDWNVESLAQVTGTHA